MVYNWKCKYGFENDEEIEKIFTGLIVMNDGEKHTIDSLDINDVNVFYKTFGHSTLHNIIFIDNFNNIINNRNRKKKLERIVNGKF